MLANYHTHTVFCDGKNTAEEVVMSALNCGFDAIGFSGHGHTPFDLSYCMMDAEGYIREIRRLQEKYRDQIQIYLGIEEDMFSEVDRSRFDYMIGSCHYIHKDGRYYSVDSGADFRNRCLQLFDGDFCAYAEHYYQAFCEYILRRKPDIVGHFDLISKYEESAPCGMLESEKYLQIATGYLKEAVKSQCIFEINSGAMARGLRTTPYPCAELLHMLKKLDAKIILSSDSHSAETLNFGFDSVSAILRDVGFAHSYVLDHGQFVKQPL